MCKKNGWKFKVYYGDEDLAYKGDKPDLAHEELYACNECYFKLFGSDNKKISTVFCVYNNKTVTDDFYDYTYNYDESKRHPEFDKFEKMMENYSC